MFRDPLVTARFGRIEYRALLVMTVGGGGEDTVIELRKHTGLGDPFRGSERAFAFPGLRLLRLARNNLKRSPQSGPCNGSGPFFLSVVFVTNFRAWGREGDVRREAGASFS
ncbi:hypothetical protein ACH4VR_37165 [Streptomyces sp. NPDC020883]|uniref:hypothetical protein n=1 Tax=unclassified Streptomyces TaxID=2593676 RepID=UPI0034E1B255